MRINKIICDICENEIDLDKQFSMGTFQRIEIDPGLKLYNNKLEKNERYDKIELDLCDECSKEIHEYIKSM